MLEHLVTGWRFNQPADTNACCLPLAAACQWAAAEDNGKLQRQLSAARVELQEDLLTDALSARAAAPVQKTHH